MNAQEKFDWIINNLEQGKTVYIQTFTHNIKTTPSNFHRWKGLGKDLFKVKNNDLWMASGRSYVCINYCGITII